MNLEGLSTERIYDAIRQGVKEAMIEAIQRTNGFKSTGDRIIDAVESGTHDAIELALKNRHSFQSAKPGDAILTAIERGTESALKRD